jgi:hypothetical protein
MPTPPPAIPIASEGDATRPRDPIQGHLCLPEGQTVIRLGGYRPRTFLK